MLNMKTVTDEQFSLVQDATKNTNAVRGKAIRGGNQGYDPWRARKGPFEINADLAWSLHSGSSTVYYQYEPYPAGQGNVS